jgi:hypothetical protein
MKLCFVSVNGPRETCFVDEPRNLCVGTADGRSLHFPSVTRKVIFVSFCRVTPEITSQLLATMEHEVESEGILATQLCSHMQDANIINNSRLNNLTGINPASRSPS